LRLTPGTCATCVRVRLCARVCALIGSGFALLSLSPSLSLSLSSDAHSLQFLIGKERLRTMIATAMLIIPAYILSITLPGVTVVFSLTGESLHLHHIASRLCCSLSVCAHAQGARRRLAARTCSRAGST
jgi:hypothetical protein